MKKIKTVIPVRCHLWKSYITYDEVLYQFEPIKVFEESFYFDKMLLNCKKCGQLYFYEWLEEIDWEYSTWIPIASAKDAELLNRLEPVEILKYTPRLQKDIPSDAKEPVASWIY